MVLMQVVAVFETNELITASGEQICLRIEVLREGSTGKFKTRTLRLDSFSMMPSFSPENDSMVKVEGDHELWVVDRFFESMESFDSVERAVESMLERIRNVVRR